MCADVLQQLSTGHPNGNKLEGRGGGTQKGNNVWVVQVSPHDSFLAESLRIPSETNGKLRDCEERTRLAFPCSSLEYMRKRLTETLISPRNPS